MDVRRDLLLATTLALAPLCLVSFGSIALLGRMTPAINQILRENDYSLEATEGMLAVLATADTSTATLPMRQAKFQTAFDRAFANVTEEAERPVLEEIRAHAPGALRGDLPARAKLVEDLGKLGAINRVAMHEVHDEAQRLGRAGAWAVVFVAFLGFTFSLLAFARLRRRILEPLRELYDTVRAVEEGEIMRRAHCPPGAPTDLVLVTRGVNQLLEDRHAKAIGQDANRDGDVIRAALVMLMDELPGSVWLTDDRGALVVANQRGLERYLGPEGPALREQWAKDKEAGLNVGDQGHRLRRAESTSDEH